MKEMECWGGAECTINRVGDTYFNQLESTGHDRRLEDLDRIAELGIRRIRFPLLWEHHWRGPGNYDFSWADARMERLQKLEIEPIVGLVHHGSGPPNTHLLRDEFAPGVAHFASAVAQRYPWVRFYTPVNEPLTTARFSALYGHWYPHARDANSFVRALLNQTRATQQAMTAIRTVNPSAQLIQTEDIGAVYSTSAVAYQATFENERRWLSLDLLCGRVTARHPLHRYLIDVGGATRDELAVIGCNPCPPNVVGVNYYVTSDRFLDERVEHYPESMRGSNGRHAYADIEAVRVLDDGIVGHERVIDVVWRRYGIPIALTEVHLGCDEREQVLWLLEAWSAARRAREQGADVRAVTAWSLFGGFDWNSLVTRNAGHYEAGAFDVRHVPPKPTLVAEAIRQLTRGNTVAADSALGWWRRKERLLYPPHTLDPAARLRSDAA